MKETCLECAKTLPNYMDLRNHVLKFHPSRLNELAPMPRYQKNSLCETCFTRFRSDESLKRHIQEVHSSENEKTDNVSASKQTSPAKEILSCTKCEFTTSNMCTYRRHIRKKHEELLLETSFPALRSPKLDKKCPLCSYIHPSKNKIIDHFTKDHRIKLQMKVFTFNNFSQFHEWKTKMEKDTTSKYIQGSKSVTHSGKRTTYQYVCHRSGYYRNRSKGSRKVKYKGTNKIDGYCPSEMMVICEENGCQMEFIKTHIGHSNEIQRTSLTRQERDYLAAKIANKVPFDKILEEARVAKDNEMSVDRLQLLTRKDLYNIAKRYNLKHSMVLWDEKHIDTWVRDTEGVIFYKAQGAVDDKYSFLNVQDFVLIIMNVSQKKIFDNFHRNLICIFSLTGLNDQFNLTTLMVRDDALSSFPCSFLFSNRIDDRIMDLYFSVLLENVGKCSVKALMTDLTDVHYDAWTKEMNSPQRRLYCSWSVDKAWRARLNKIKSTEQRRSVYTALKNLQTESIEHKYKKMLHDFLNDDSVDAEFRKYFAENFVVCEKLWACCYRVEDDMNEDSQLQQMHDHLKYICTHGKNSKPLSQVLNAVMKMVSDNLVSRKVILNSNETLYHLNLIQKRHRDSYLGNLDSIITVSEGWHVPSFTELNESYELFFVQQVLEKCNCNYSCSECHACIHQFMCSCIDQSVEGNMCKHIHLVIRYRDGKKHFILDEGSGKFKDINSEDENEKSLLDCIQTSESNHCVSPDNNVRKSVTSEHLDDTKFIQPTVDASKTSFHNDDYDDIDIGTNSSSDTEVECEIVVDDMSDINTLELTSTSKLAKSPAYPTSINNRIPISFQQNTSINEIRLENKRNEVISKFKNQINRIKSLEEMNFLENILSQIDEKINEFKANSNMLS